MQTDNCAILNTDVLVDAGYLLDLRQSATPAEFHALNSLVEAVVFHEKLYLYDVPKDYVTTEVYRHLVEEKIIHPEHSARIFETELKSRGMKDIAGDVLVDRTFGNHLIAYHADSGASTLSSLVKYEKHLGFARMAKLHDKGQEIAIVIANLLNFHRDDEILMNDSYRRARAFATCAAELDLEMYTGIISRPFVIGVLSARRRTSLILYKKMLAELDDVEDADLPSWRSIEIPALTQVLLRNCKDSPDALPNELTKLRHRLRKFRKTLTDQAKALKSARSRGEKRKVRRETEQAWAALLEKQDHSTRITHQVWEILKSPIKAPIAAMDKLVERDKQDQIILKVQGLTDLWRVLYDAPTIEQNVKLVKNVFRIDVNPNDWNQISRAAGELDSLMKRNDEPSLPDVT